MQNLNDRVNDALAYGNHLSEITRLLKTPLSAPSKKSRNRHLLRAYRELKKSGITVSWFSHSSFTIAKKEYVREGVRIGIESTTIPGQFCPVEYFTLQKCLSAMQVKFPACNTPILLQKLVQYKMLSLSETLPAFEQLQSVN